AGLVQRLDDDHLVGDAVLGDHALFDVAGDVPAHRLRIDARLRLGHEQRHRPLAPLRAGRADHGGFADAGELRDDVLQVELGNPLATGLDHVLDAVGDVQDAPLVEAADVAGMQRAAAPQLLRALRVAEVALGQPGRAEHHFADALAVARQRLHVLVHRAHVVQHHRLAGAAAQRRLGLQVGLQLLAGEVVDDLQRPGLGHAVAGVDVDAALQRRPRQALGHGRAA